MSSRHDQIARFYEHNAAALLRAVARSIVGPAAMIEDACSHAWCQLLAHPDVRLGPNGFGWLYLVAKREAFRLSDRARREPAAGEPSELPDPAAASGPDAWQVLERRLTHQDRASVLAGLSERKQRLLILHAAGYTYAEIVALTGDSPRTVERQLLRGRRSLRRHQATQA